MAGRGPAPRDPSTLSRRNRASTEATINAADDTGEWPKLPPLRLLVKKTEIDPETGMAVQTSETVPGRYRAATREWYRQMQALPQASQWLGADRMEIARLAILVDAFFSGRDQSAATSKAIESSLARFAMTLQDRWRMKIAVDRGRRGLASVSSIDRDAQEEAEQLASLMSDG